MFYGHYVFGGSYAEQRFGTRSVLVIVFNIGFSVVIRAALKGEKR